MTFRIEFGREAKRDLWGYYEYASQRSRADAIRWLERFEAAIGTLAERPERCSLSRESRRMQVDLRDFLFGRRPYVYRVVFLIDGDTVRVLRICRSQRSTLTTDEIDRAISDE